MTLTVDHVRESSKQHKRCGTSFLIIVMLISILFFMVVRVDNVLLRMASRIILVPVIAGVSYEFLRLAGRSDNPIVNLLSKPGLWMQNPVSYTHLDVYKRQPFNCTVIHCGTSYKK